MNVKKVADASEISAEGVRVEIKHEEPSAKVDPRVTALTIVFSDFKPDSVLGETGAHWVLYSGGTVVIIPPSWSKKSRGERIALANEILQSRKVIPGTPDGDFEVNEQDEKVRPGCAGVYFTIYPSCENIMSITISAPSIGATSVTALIGKMPLADRRAHMCLGLSARNNREKDAKERIVVATSAD
jgi:hypothetical protein